MASWAAPLLQMTISFIDNGELFPATGFLHGLDVVTGIQEPRRERVAADLVARQIVETCTLRGPLQNLVDALAVEKPKTG
jgi:hypothetical protein